MRRPLSNMFLRLLILSGFGLLVAIPIYVRLSCNSRQPDAMWPDNQNILVSVCHTPQCIANYESVPRQSRVPPIRHILWKSSHVSRYMAKQLKTWSDIHPGWKYVLWRDSDMDKFVAKHYPGVLTKFQSLPRDIMRIDMIRYMIMHKFGGVYADLDYVLTRSLDRFQKFPAVVTREAEVHSLFHFGMEQWPPRVLGNPAFLMSEPRHPFFYFCISQLARRPADGILQFAGPLGLSDLLALYSQAFPVAASPELAVYVPAFRNFYPYGGNNLNSSTNQNQGYIRDVLRKQCQKWWPSASKHLTAYCTNILVLDPITDPSEPVYAIHDSSKRSSSHDSGVSSEFYDDPVNVSSVLPTIVTADTIY